MPAKTPWYQHTVGEVPRASPTALYRMIVVLESRMPRWYIKECVFASRR